MFSQLPVLLNRKINKKQISNCIIKIFVNFLSSLGIISLVILHQKLATLIEKKGVDDTQIKGDYEKYNKGKYVKQAYCMTQSGYIRYPAGDPKEEKLKKEYYKY